MSAEQMQSAVGPGKENRPGDVRVIQRLLDRSSVAFSGRLPLSGHYDRQTRAAVITFQSRAMRMAFPTGVVAPGDETFWRLKEGWPARMLAGRGGGIPLAPRTGDAVLYEDDYQAAAKVLQCEVGAIKAVTRVESPKGPFDAAGRPSILFERHHFSRLSWRRYDGTFPFISNPLRGGYSFPEGDQYKRLQQAYALDSVAALQATSWGAFQLMGFNYGPAGFGRVEDFVIAMCQSAQQQLESFVSFIQADPNRLSAIQTKNWAKFALHYNGSDYATNKYDINMAQAYRSLQP